MEDIVQKQLDNAVSAFFQNQMSVRADEELYGIPKSTLGDRISGRVLPGTASGAVRYLADSEEEELAEFIVGSASIGYPKTIQDILATVQSILALRGVHRIVTYGWWGHTGDAILSLPSESLHLCQGYEDWHQPGM